MRVSGQHQAPAALLSRKKAGTPCTWGLVDPRDVVNGCEEERIFFPHRLSNPETSSMQRIDYSILTFVIGRKVNIRK
jgi:hypothetical protein